MNFEIRIPERSDKGAHNSFLQQTTPMTPVPYPANISTITDHLSVLLSLAESYFHIAHCNCIKSDFDRSSYLMLISTGLRCLEAALHQFKLQPKIEAMVRLRYASILNEETENIKEAEEALHKGILIAQKNNFLDLKYSMQHLLVRIMFRMKERASLLRLKDFIDEAQQYNMTHWTYAFRFLHCSLRMEPSPVRDENAALDAVRQVHYLATHQQDHHIRALANLMEATIHLGTGVIGVESAKKALERARELQLRDTPQIDILCQIVDNMCSVLIGNGPESQEKVRQLQQTLDEKAQWEGFAENGDFVVPVKSIKQGREQEPEMLRFRWLPKGDIWVLGWYLGGASRFHQNGLEQKAEKSLQLGLDLIETLLEGQQDHGLYTVEAAAGRMTWRRTLRIFMQIQLTFVLCSKGDYIEAIKSLRLVQAYASTLDPELLYQRTTIGPLIRYLSGVIYQGTGDLDLAMKYFQTPPSESTTEIGILSALNSSIVAVGPRMNNERLARSLLTSIHDIASTHQNMLIRAAYNLVKAALETHGDRMNLMRQSLATSQKLSRQVSNHQMLGIALAITCRRIFDVDPNRNLNMTRAGFMTAVKTADPLWVSVTGYSVANSYVACGKLEEAAEYKRNSDVMRKKVEEYLNLPAELRP